MTENSETSRPVHVGRPVSYLVLADGVPAYDSRGAQVGQVAHVLADEGADIFHGLLIRLPPAGDGYRFADRTQIAGLFERGVTLAVTADALRDPSEDPVAAGVASGDSIREGLRRAWEWLQRPV